MHSSPSKKKKNDQSKPVERGTIIHMKNALAKTNEPVIDPATMSPIQLYEAIDSK